jgi:predicted ATPase
MYDHDSDEEIVLKKEKIKEISTPIGIVNGPVKHKKIKTPQAAKELFALHTSYVFIGMNGSGKTHVMVILTKQYLDDACFTRVFIISPTYESNPIFHVLKNADEDVYSSLHSHIQDIVYI